MWVRLQLKAGGILRVSYCPPGNSWGITSPGRQVQCTREASCAVASRQDRNFQFHRFQKPELSDGLSWKEPTLIPTYPYTHSLLLWFQKNIIEQLLQELWIIRRFSECPVPSNCTIKQLMSCCIAHPSSLPLLFFNFLLVINPFCSSICIDHGKNPQAFAK